ncbi:MAG: hypothetical protein R6V85_19135 [Polyangia bacterium]
MQHWIIVISLAVGLSIAARPTDAQNREQQPRTKQATEAEEPEPADSEGEESEAEAEPDAADPPQLERSYEACRDSVDNDGDGYVDCDDQDCEIYAACARAAAPPPPPKNQAPGPTYQLVQVGSTHPAERGRLCRDGLDNDGNGLADCHEAYCQRSRYCRSKMYFVPEPKNKPMGLTLELSMLGLALPNFRRPTAEVRNRRYAEEIPFSPDIGYVAGTKVGLAPLPWLGFGVNLMFGVTAASNRGEQFGSDTSYRYDAAKGFAHGGLYARLQWVWDRVVPYVDLAGGYTYAAHYWQVYSPYERWEDIDEQDRNELRYPMDKHRYVSRHFTLAVEPGVDIFLRKRSVALGLSAWLPVLAVPLEESSTDNVGLMFHLTYTPTWREDPKLKPEYEKDFPAEEDSAE